jgi:Mlc titration factor MtfA (ptsG expression regulator)
MLLFLQEVPMEGCRGLDLTEEIRVTIAAQACLLLLHMDYPRYLRVRRVLVYPSTFVPKTVKPPGNLEIHRPARPTLGEGWRGGVVVLSWDAVRHGASVIEDGRNVVLHEFAHMLDLEDSAFDGVPVFDTASAYRAWAAALALRFTLHVDATKRGRRRPIREYGATNRAEYFAVATEAFFEKPWQLRKREPELYTQLVDFFRQDPASYPSST